MYQVNAPSPGMVQPPIVTAICGKRTGERVASSPRRRRVRLEVELVDVLFREPEWRAQQDHVAQRQRALRRDVVELRGGLAGAEPAGRHRLLLHPLLQCTVDGGVRGVAGEVAESTL